MAKKRFATGGFAQGLTSGLQLGQALSSAVGGPGSAKKKSGVAEPTADTMDKPKPKPGSGESDGMYRRGGRVGAPSASRKRR